MPTLLNFPSTVPATLRWIFERSDVTVEAPRSWVSQRSAGVATRWGLSITLPPMQGEAAALVRVFLQRATSAAVWFQAPDHSYERQSTPSGTPRVDGAGQTGATLNLKGFPASQPSAVKDGDRIGLTTGQVVTVVASGNADGAGKIPVSIDPPLRASPTDDALVYLDEPLCVFRLPTHRVDGYVSAPMIHTFVFDAVEDKGTGVPSVNYGAWP